MLKYVLIGLQDVEPGPLHGSGSSRPQFKPSDLSRPYNPPSGQLRESTGPVGHASGSSRPGQTFNPSELSKPYNGDQQRAGYARPGQTFNPSELSKPYNGDQQRDVKRG